MEKESKDPLHNWFCSMIEAMGRGGSKEAAEILGLTQSRISRLQKTGSFNKPMLQCVAWLMKTKAENYPTFSEGGVYTVFMVIRKNGYVFEMRRSDVREPNLIWTWRLDKPDIDASLAEEAENINGEPRHQKQNTGSSNSTGRWGWLKAFLSPQKKVLKTTDPASASSGGASNRTSTTPAES